MSEHSSTSIRLETNALPAGSVETYRVRGHETISQLFSFEVDVHHSGSPLSTGDLIGADACLVFERDGVEVRRVYGMLKAAQRRYRRQDQQTQAYRLTLVPSVHRMSLVRTQEIFQDQSIVDIIRTKAELIELASQCNLAGLLESYPAREFVVQFNESDLSFISRLAEHMGISFYFSHSDGIDVMTFTDHRGGFGQPVQAGLRINQRREELGIIELQETSQIIPEHYVVMDYNYRTPDIDLLANSDVEHGFGGAVVEWGDHFKTVDEGNRIAKLRAEELDATQQLFAATSNVCELSAGFVFTLEDHDELDGAQVLITTVQHSYDAPASGHAGSSDSAGYRNSFQAIDAKRSYRPPRITPKPRINGLLTGIIEPQEHGAVERNPRLDEAGRYRVKFLYDTTPLGGPKASRPVRQAQPTVGADYGMHFPLRPGIEVLLGFVNGDPDRPIIMGAVHNARTPAHVRASNVQQNIIRSASGITMRFKDN